MSNDPRFDSHCGVSHYDRGALKWLMDKYRVRTMLDIGCGSGGQLHIARELGINAFGVDGDPRATVSRYIQQWDFEKGALNPNIDNVRFDVGWCVEFVEHVSEAAMPNYMACFKRCNLIVMTHSTRFSPQHVNAKPPFYWRQKMNQNGFDYMPNATEQLKLASTMQREFMSQTGMMFRRVE